MIDFEALQTTELMHLFVTATSVATGQPHIFHHKELTADALMASACLPSMFHAVDIQNHHYWDGGYAGNPSIWPLAYISETSDIVVVEINPVMRKETPINANDINNRINEISFNASLIAEIKSIHFINDLIDENDILSDKYRKLHIHLINSPEEMLSLNASSKLNTSLEFIEYLYYLGRKAAEKWITKNFDYLGNESSIDIHDAYLRHIKHPF
jgi:NTE family protein